MKIKILATGGTLDKRYNPLTGELIFSETSVGNLLKQSRSTLEIDLEVLMLKDSLDMNDDDRDVIVHACNQSDEQHIVITHGTDTMVESAQAIAKGSPKSKVVVLLGAMVPYLIEESDALFNLGCALTAVQILEPGVYITMNGKIFDHREVKKNRAIGQFEGL